MSTYGNRYPGSGSVPVWTAEEKRKAREERRPPGKRSESDSAARQKRWEAFLAKVDRDGRTMTSLRHEFYALDPRNKPPKTVSSRTPPKKKSVKRKKKNPGKRKKG